MRTVGRQSRDSEERRCGGADDMDGVVDGAVDAVVDGAVDGAVDGTVDGAVDGGAVDSAVDGGAVDGLGGCGCFINCAQGGFLTTPTRHRQTPLQLFP